MEIVTRLTSLPKKCQNEDNTNSYVAVKEQPLCHIAHFGSDILSSTKSDF